MKFTLEEIAKLVDGSIAGDPSKEINGVNSLVNADSDQISYAVSDKYKESLSCSSAGAIIVNTSLKKHCKTNAIIVKNVYLAYSILSKKFQLNQDIKNLKYGSEQSYPKSRIAANCLIGLNVNIGITNLSIICQNNPNSKSISIISE